MRVRPVALACLVVPLVPVVHGQSTAAGAPQAPQTVVQSKYPTVVFEMKPEYTEEARRAGIQGIVEVEAVVGTDGKVDRARISKSLDKQYGLDDEAVRVAKLWRFAPGTLNGTPVPALVIIQLEFRFPVR